MGDGMIDLRALAQGVALVPALAAYGALAALAQRLGCGFSKAIAGRGLAGVFAVERQARLKVQDVLLHLLHLRRQRLHLLPQGLDQRIFLRMAQVGQIGQALHGGYSRLSVQSELSSYPSTAKKASSPINTGGSSYDFCSIPYDTIHP